MSAPNPIDALLASFASAFTQESRLLRLQLPHDCGLPADALLPHRLEGSEYLSRCYRYDLDCLSTDAYIELKQLLGLPVAVDILLANGLTRRIAGLVTHAEHRSTDGGFARYGLIIEPALATLEHAHASRVFSDLSAPDIVQEILSRHCADNPAFSIAFSVEVQLHKQYPPRSYCLQYRESTLAFIERILVEEGISYRFIFPQDGDEPQHRMALFDSADSLEANTQETVRFHRADGTEEADTITAWSAVRQILSGKTDISSFDYKTVSRYDGRHESLIAQGDAGTALASGLESYEPQTNYYSASPDEAERYAELRQQAKDVLAKTFIGDSTVRSLQAGDWFSLRDHPIHDQDLAEDRQFVVTSLSLRAQNNYAPDVKKALMAASVLPSRSGLGGADAESPYTNRFTAVRRGIPLVPHYDVQRHGKPAAHGPQTAIVVGPPGEEIFTDEHGRIRIQFHWQRPDDHPDGGAAFDDRSSTWVRVVYPSAGAGWGSQYIPRISQEVVINFLDGDIDRPICTGVVHNGTQVPPLFSGAGNLPANKALSGIKTKEVHGSGYNELVLDDTTNELRTKLSSEHGKTQLNQGYLIHPRTDGKGLPRGEGFELHTNAAGALRAAKGLLLSAEVQTNAAGTQLARQALLQTLDAALALTEQLGTQAVHQHANQPETGTHNRLTEDDAVPGPSSSHGHQAQLSEALHNLERGSNTDPHGKSGQGNQPGGQHIVAISGPDGVAMASNQSITLAAGTNLDQVAQRDLQQTAGRRWIHNVGESISLFVAGTKAKVKDTFKLIAAKGNIRMEAQDGQLAATAQQDVTITSVNGKVVVQAPKEILLTAGGGYIRIGANIEIHNPGKQSQRATGFSLTGPTSMNVEMPRIAKLPIQVDPTRPLYSQQIDMSHLAHHDDMLAYSSKNKPYRVYDKEGSFIASGTTDENGMTDRIFTNEPKELVVLFDEGTWEVEEYIESVEREPENEKGENGEEETA
jgi:type VI secretion system secreted protein VgrG